MKKSVLCIIIVALMMFMLSGCIEIDISTGIDADFTSYLSYHLAMDISGFDTQYQDILKRAFNRIGWHYQEELGFNVQLLIDDDPITLTMTQRIENDSFEQAFASLEAMLTNEDITVFMQVDMVYQSFERQNRYLFSALTDIPQIMKLSNAEELPPPLLLQLEEAIDTGKGNITLSFPVSEVDKSTHRANVQNNQTTMVVPLSFTGQTEFEITGILNLLRDGSPGGTFDEIINEQVRLKNIALIVCIAAAGLLLITIICAALTGKKRRKKINNYDNDISI